MTLLMLKSLTALRIIIAAFAGFYFGIMGKLLWSILVTKGDGKK